MLLGREPSAGRRVWADAFTFTDLEQIVISRQTTPGQQVVVDRPHLAKSFGVGDRGAYPQLRGIRSVDGIGLQIGMERAQINS